MNAYSMKGIRALAILVVAALAFSAIPMATDEPVVGNAAAAGDGYVRVGWLSTIVNWNPLAIEMVEDYVACYLIHSSLWTYDQDWNGPVNDLATGYWYEVHANGSMTTHINITDNAYFRNAANIDDTSHQLTSEDVVFSLQTMKENSGGAFDWYLTEVTDIKTDGEFSLTLWTSYQKATLIDDLTSLPIIPKYVWQDVANPLGSMKAEDLVGSGPFVYESMLKDSWYKFKRAPHYHGATDYPGVRDVDEGLNGILYTVYSDMSSLSLNINTGIEDCAVFTGDVPTFSDTVGKGAKVNVIKAPVQENGICDIAINAIPLEFRTPTYCTGNPLLLDPFVREAIMLTLNKTYINETLLRGMGTLAESVVDPGYWHAEIQDPLVYNIQEARDVLEADDWTEGSNGYYVAGENTYGVQMKYFEAGDELSGIRCQAPDTDPTYGYTVIAWQGWAQQAGIGLVSTVESEITMINQAWYKSDYDIWVWHWGWGPEPLGGALSCWLTQEIVGGGDNCQGPMGEWWVHSGNYTDSPYVNDSMIEEFNMDDPDFSAFSSFDQNFSRAMQTLDVEDRKVIVDRLQQQIYDSHTENPPYYDLGLYAYTDYRFTNWGDWGAHNGLNVCSDLLWLWFELEPRTNWAPAWEVPPQDAYTAYKDVAEDFVVAVSDYEGDSLWVNYSFGDGAVEKFFFDSDTVDTTVATYANTSHTYTTPADELVFSVSLTDGFSETQYRNATIEVQGTLNLAPQFTSAMVPDVPSPTYTDVPVTWTVSAKDPDGGELGTDLKFTWSWGDSTYSVETITGIEDDVAVTSEQTHTWTTPAEYNVKVSVYDEGSGYSETGEHNVSLTWDYEVIVNQPPADPIIESIYGAPGADTICTARSSDSDMDELTFTWEWDDGTYTVEKLTPASATESVTSEVTHVWDAIGNYSVTVWVDDGNGHNVSADANAEISNDQLPPGAFALTVTPTPVLVGVETTFNASAADANGDALIITIDFGDGNMSSATTAGGVTTRQYAEFIHSYEVADTYTVVIYADDGTDNETSSGYEIVVSAEAENSAPQVQFPTSFNVIYNVETEYAPLLVTDADGDELTVWYDWGDETAMSLGDPDNGYAASHTYMDVGTFTLSMYVDDGNGHNVTATAEVAVSESNYNAACEKIDLDPVKDEYQIGETITFVVTVSDMEGDEVTVVIEFGDGTTDEETVDTEAMEDTEVTFTHSYDAAGDYEVNATADDGLDHSDPELDTASVELTVASEPGISMLLVAGIVLILVIALVAAMLFLKKKKGKGQPETLGGMEGMAMTEEPPKP